MNKTPVSILQEMMVKNQSRPDYELVHNGGGTHMNTFTYRVTCDGLSATGTGRCKKDAKHEAAKAMLETIAKHRAYPQLPASPAQSPVRTPLPASIPVPPRIPPNVPFVNAIGALQDICTENNLQDPEYQLISDIGPPHARVFTICCIVATFREEGIATTKKLAKHEAAKKMLERIHDLVADLKNVDIGFHIQNEEMKRKEIIANGIAIARYPLLSRLPTTNKINLGLKLIDYHIKFKSGFDAKTKDEVTNRLMSLIPEDTNDISEESLNNLLSEFGALLSTLNLELSQEILPSVNEGIYIAVVGVNTSPKLVCSQLGTKLLDTLLRATLDLINTMIFLLK